MLQLFEKIEPVAKASSRRFSWRMFALVYVLATVADFIAALHVYALARGWMIVALLFGFLLPYANFVDNSLFIDSKSTRTRLLITTAAAMGVVTGSAAALFLMGE